MTEEIRERPDSNQESSNQTGSQENTSKVIVRTLTISSVFLAYTVFDSMFQYREFGAWQILADAGGILIALVLLLVSLFLHRKGKTEQGNNLIPFVILFGYAPGDLFLEGVTLYNLGSGILLFALAYIILKPKNLPYWLRMLVIYIALVSIFSQINLPRFDISQSPSWQVSLPIFTAVLSILLGWQIITTIQLKTIQSRLLIILIGLGFIPTLIATTTSTAIGFQRDLNQAENYLQTVSSLKNEQISTWYTQITRDVDKLIADPQFSEDIDILLNNQPVESYRNKLISDLRTEMQALQIETGRFLDLSIVSLDGEILVSTNPDFEGFNIGESDSNGTNIGNKNYFSFGKTETFRTPLVNNQETNLPETQIYQPVTSMSLEILAVIFADINTDYITQAISETAQLGETGEAYLVSINNHLLTPLRNSSEFSGTSDFVSSPGISETIQNQGSRTLRENNIQDQPVIGTYSWNQDLQTVLVIEQSETEAFQSLRLNVIINSAVGIATLAITITIAFVTARNFSEPIKTLSDAASGVRLGELKQIEPIDRVDEIGELSHTLSQMTRQLVETTANLEETVAERTKVLERRAKYLETTSQISRALTSIYDIDNLLNTVTHLISENFGFYHVGVFIMDDQKEYAVLRAANSEGGWKMLAREHKLRVGDQGIVGFVTGSGQSRIQQQVVGEDSVHFTNPDLPLTKSEMALPLKIGNDIFGALDVQSTEEEAFSQEDVSALQVLADSVAVAIQNTRLVQQLQERLETERRLYGEITKDAWTTLLGRKSFTPAFSSNESGTHATSAALTPTGRQALSRGITVIGNSDTEKNQYPIAVPVKVRGGTTIAVVETQKPKSAGPWTKEEITILESVSDDLAIALENARLVEETQRKAQRDRIAAELATKIWASSDVENILQTAVRELGSALQVSRGTIQLTLPKETLQGHNPDGATQP